MDLDNAQASVMVVDDTPANQKLMEEILRGHGFRVLQFLRGGMALRAAGQKPPDLILLDIMMPEMDGFEVCRRLKADEALRDIPVIFMSALDDVANKVRAFTEGGVDYVTKPFQEEEVLARVNTHLNQRRMQRELKKHNLYLEELVQEKVKEISDSQMATILALSKLAEFRDDETGRHIERTQKFITILAEKLRDNPRYAASITDAFIENLYYAAPLHDIGKVGIPDHILLKPGRLTPEEFEVMKTHTTMGAMTLQRARAKYPQNAFLNMGIALTRSHHEKWDGSGYPDGLAGEDIPLSARLMALVDVYDALRSKRPYKEAFSHEKSCEIIAKDKGAHFDPVVVDAFIALESEFAAIRARLGEEDA